MARLICGADGCSAGWVSVTEDLSSGQLFWQVNPSLEVLARTHPVPDLITLDVPIGLLDSGARECDKAARRLLGPGRGSSVFPAPIRCLLEARSHLEACAAREQVEGKRLSIQSWAIVPKIREVDSALRASPMLRARVREVHPEVCFYYLASGRPVVHSKKTPEGRRQRHELLQPHFGNALDRALDERRRLGCAEDDLLDAFAALWTARRITRGEAVTIPSEPPRDRFDLPMEMVA